MAKLIILSIIVMSLAIPIRLSTAPNPKRALRKVLWMMVAYIVLWSYMCLHWYPALVTLQ